MDDAFYDTSWHVCHIATITSTFKSLLTPIDIARSERAGNADRLSTHADVFAASIGRDRPLYEEKEENTRFGKLKQCTWTRLRMAGNDDVFDESVGQKRKRPVQRSQPSVTVGLLISLIYEKSTHKFIIYTASDGSGGSEGDSAVLLYKSPPHLLTALTTYLSDTFALGQVHPLKLPSSFIQSTLETYLSGLHASLSDTDRAFGQDSVDSGFQSAIGALKLTVSFSAPVAPHLKTLEIAVPPQTVLQSIRTSSSRRPPRGPKATLMASLSTWLSNKTGLTLPLPTQDDFNETGDAETTSAALPLKVSKISTAAYAISVDHLLKFASKALDGVDPGGEPGENVVRMANEDLLCAIVDEARRQSREDGS